jgi:hypothetical protein
MAIPAMSTDGATRRTRNHMIHVQRAGLVASHQTCGVEHEGQVDETPPRHLPCPRNEHLAAPLPYLQGAASKAVATVAGRRGLGRSRSWRDARPASWGWLRLFAAVNSLAV